jgi:hypothetical protein
LSLVTGHQILATSTLSGTQGIVILAALALALAALVACATLALSLRRVRRDQRLVLGEEGEGDLVGHAAEMQRAFEALQRHVVEVVERLEGRLANAESALELAISHRALVRYDAYNELSGRQSMSIAMLDGTCSGIVLSCIHHRDQARLYAKQVHDGRSELELSPEEAEAIRIALSTQRGGDGSPVSA